MRGWTSTRLGISHHSRWLLTFGSLLAAGGATYAAAADVPEVFSADMVAAAGSGSASGTCHLLSDGEQIGRHILCRLEGERPISSLGLRKREDEPADDGAWGMNDVAPGLYEVSMSDFNISARSVVLLQRDELAVDLYSDAGLLEASGVFSPIDQTWAYVPLMQIEGGQPTSEQMGECYVLATDTSGGGSSSTKSG